MSRGEAGLTTFAKATVVEKPATTGVRAGASWRSYQVAHREVAGASR